MDEDRLELRIAVGGHSRHVFATGTIIIGRDPSASITVEDRRVSRHHLLIQRRGDRWEARDASRNGTFHNGVRITELSVTAFTQLRLGNAVDGPLVELEPIIATAVVPPVPIGGATSPLKDDLIDEFRNERSSRALGAYSGVVDIPQTTVTIGRSASNDIVVRDMLVSRRHAVLRGDHTHGYALQDLNSQNGTFVNGQRITRVELGEHDLITIGRHQFRLVAGLLERYIDVGEVAFEAIGLGTVTSNGAVLLEDVSFVLSEKSFMAIAGPSGAGKTTLLNALTGFRAATSGRILYDGWDLYANYEALRHRIGYVPQDDVLHPQLTVRRALEFAASLRFPPDVTSEERRGEVAQVMETLGISGRADLPISQLSGGQRKRASIALELLTRPSLLILDEPTAGLDPGTERVVMQLLRQLADDGHTVIIATHSVQSLDLCDHILFMALGGKLAYFGPPKEALSYFDEEDYADVFGNLGREDDTDWQQRFRSHSAYERYVLGPLNHHRRPVIGQSQIQQPIPRQGWRVWRRQLRVLMHRYLTIIASDRRNAWFLILQALVMGVLLVVMMPANHLDPGRDPASGRPRASMVILALILSITWIAASNSIREIVKETAIYRRERAFGLSISAYVASKSIVLGMITIFQAVALTMLALQRQGTPITGVVFHSPLIEITLGVVLAGLAAMTLGLLVSAIVNTADKALTIFPLLLIPQLVFAGPIFPVDRNPATEAVSYLWSAKWGFAAVASTVDLNVLQGETAQQDTDHILRLWRHMPGVWTINMTVLATMTVACVCGTWFVLWRRDQA